MKKFFVFAVLWAVSCLAFAQHKVSGVVLNQSGETLPGAVVVLGQNTSVAGNDGRFVFPQAAEGRQKLEVRFLGFELLQQWLDVRRDQDLELVMEEVSIMAGEVTVAGIRARGTDPVALSELSKEELEERNFGQDLPYLLNMTPGLVVSSDAGTGIGYTGMRLRGSDLTRINVTVNGIPMNDAESQGVFWVNMPDLAASVSRVQVQRGVGTSSNGAAAFGGSVNFSTLNGAGERQVLIDNAYGSFGTWRNSVQLQTGLLDKGFAFDARLSRVTSEGFVDRSDSDLKSFYLSGGWFGEKTSVRLVTFSGQERTMQAWNGVPKVKLENDMEGMEQLVADDGWAPEEAANLYQSSARTFNRYMYDNQTDNYQQDHYQLHLSHKPSANILLNGALHYTRGKGYYESFKYNERFTKYNLPLTEVELDGNIITRSDVIAQKWLDNHFYGATFSGVYSYGRIHGVLGGGWNRYDGDHFGDVVWMEVNAGIPAGYRWYFNEGSKEDLSYFAKLSFEWLPGFTTYADAQLRHVKYEISGVHDDQRDLTRSTDYDFFNPKIGLNYEWGQGGRAFASVAVANREPSRSDFRDADEEVVPQAERLLDYEAGLEWQGEQWALQLNGFYMDYTDQLVLTGKINNVGAYIMNNVPESYRAGLELAIQARLLKWLNWGANVVWSTNKIKNFSEYVDNWDTWEQEVNELGTTDLAFSPEWTMASRLEAVVRPGLRAILNTRYVGNQYVDNTSSSERRLDAYLVNDLILRFRPAPGAWKGLELGLQVNNLFDAEYLSNAWVYSYKYNDQRRVMDGYFPQAGRHFMGQVVLRF